MTDLRMRRCRDCNSVSFLGGLTHAAGEASNCPLCGRVFLDPAVHYEELGQTSTIVATPTASVALV